MGLREIAEADLVNIFGSPDGPGTPFTLIAPNNSEYMVNGTYGDISLLIDPASGAAVQGRTIIAVFPMALLRSQTDLVPEKKWRVKVKSLKGEELTLFVVQPPDHDLTIGLTRLTLGANL